eukprot:405247-Pleurochrysis_carterae.AAC.1
MGRPAMDVLPISRQGRIAPDDRVRRTDHPRERARYPYRDNQTRIQRNQRQIKCIQQKPT